MKNLLVVPATLILMACGQGGTDVPDDIGRAPLPDDVPPPDVGIILELKVTDGANLYGDSAIVVNDSVGFSVIGQNVPIASVEWRQLSGPSLDILAANSQTVGFDVPEVGGYIIQATVLLEDATTVEVTHEFDAANAIQANANIRLDHTVSERSGVSLRVDSDLDAESALITWRQVAGPEVSSFEVDGNQLFFNAPAVATDSVVVFDASLSFPSGVVQTDSVFLTIKNVDVNEDGYFFGNDQIVTEDTFVVNQDSPFKSAVESCVYTNQLASTCSFSRLPLIGQTTTAPSVDDILDKTLVSHAWMGQRFKEYLEQSSTGEDMLKLLRGVTAVVISYDVRPSFYWAATGAIYLDADNFWLTPQERDTLNEQADFRADFGRELNFIVPWRYVKNNNSFPTSRYPTEDRETRTFSDFEADIAWLMYHELGHANDFFPPNTWDSYSLSSNPLTEFRNNGTNSDILNVQFPLNSAEMHALARVSFAGETASTLQRSYDASDLIPFFEPDISPSYYSYLNEREDYATLFERFMMKYRLDASADVALITLDDNPDFIVSWGQRDRFNQSSLQDRVRFAVERVLPELGNIRAIQQDLPAPVLMDPTKSWFDNIAISTSINKSVSSAINTSSIPLLDPISVESSFMRHSHIHDGVPNLPQQ